MRRSSFSAERTRGARPGATSVGSRRGRVAVLVLLVPLLWACDTTEPELVGNILIGEVDRQLMVGTTLQLTATVLSTTGSVMTGHPVTWSSSPESVATVSTGGLVTALTPGTVTIRSTSGQTTASVTLTVEAGPCTQATAGALTVGQTRAGTLDSTDCTFFGQPAEGWTFGLASMTGFRIAMSSAAFQPDLILTDVELNVLRWSNWTGEGVELRGQLPEGQYIVWAIGVGYGNPVSGEYQISASAEAFCTAESVTAAIAPGESRSGALDETDCILPHDVRGVGYRLDLAATAGLRIDLSSSAFDPVVVVTDADLSVVASAVGGPDSSARIERLIPAGEFYIWVTGFHDGVSGPFELSVSEVEIAICEVVGDIEVGQAVSGTLSGTDCVMEEAWYVDPWRLVVEAETSVRIDLTSNDFDTVLILEDAAGAMLDWDDDGGSGLNSRLTRTLAPGEYRVVVTSYGGGATGAYALSVQSVAVTGAAPLALTRPAARPQWLKAATRDATRD